MEAIREKLLLLFDGCSNNSTFEELIELIEYYGNQEYEEGWQTGLGHCSS